MLQERERCWRCRRPAKVCYCAQLPKLESRTRVVILQHPREAKMAVGTARMAHLSLANSELHTGVTFESNPRVRELALADSGTAVLFPGEGAQDPSALGERAPHTLIVIDGTWPQARKVYRENPFLHRLPRIGFVPRRPGNYRIRKEPDEDCVSTIEAVAEVLGRLEGDPDRFDRMLGAFDWMVDRQLDHKESREGPSRYKKLRKESRPPVDPVPRELRVQYRDLVLFYAEGNAPGLLAPVNFEPELIQLCAVRPCSGERFHALVRPQKPLGENIPTYVELSAETLLGGEAREEALARWRAFLRPEDLLCGWGYFSTNLLVSAGEPLRPFVDLRLASTRCLKKRTGGVEQAVELLARGKEPLASGAEAPFAPGRAGRRLWAMERALELLRAWKPGERR